LLVGGAAFVLDAAIMWALIYLSVGPYIARIISLCASILFTFVLNRKATFSAKGKVTWQEFGAYVGASFVGIAINYAIFAGCLKLGMMWLMAMVLGTGTASAFNFFAYGRIFKRR
jgi:putative flippase GtrA